MPAELRSQIEKENEKWFLAKKMRLAEGGRTLQAFSVRQGCIPCAAKWKFQLAQEIRVIAGIYVTMFQASLERTDQLCL